MMHVASFPKRAVLAVIRFYQKARPHNTRGCCKYIPTCSEYGYTAVERFGAAKGLALAFWRFLRCNPFSRGGYDPVPEIKPKIKAP